MSDVLNHQFVSAAAEGADATKVRTSNWNAGHTFSGGANGNVLVRDTSDATYGAAWSAATLSAAGALTIPSHTVTVSTPLIDASQTWNDAGVTFDADVLNITNTASAASSTLLNRKVGGASLFAIRYNGSAAVFALNYGTFFTTVDSTAQFVISGTTAPCYFDLNPSTQVFLRGNVAATGGATAKHSPSLVWSGRRWTGAASTTIQAAAELRPHATIDSSYLAFGFSDNNDQMLVLTHGTRVGIGITAPDSTLHVAGTVTISDTGNLVVGSTTGTKIGTATTQKLSLWNAAPVTQPAGIVDADGTLADITTKFNGLLLKLETIGVLAAA